MERDDLLKQKEEEEVELNKQIATLQSDCATLLKKAVSEIMPEAKAIRIHLGRGWSWRDNEIWEIQADIGFADPEGKRELEFASDLDFTLTNNGIKINHGCCGTFTKKDFNQINRAKLIYLLFENEDRLLSIFKDFVNIDLLVKRDEVYSEIERINNEIRKEKSDAERASLLEKLNKAKYIYNICRNYNWDTKKYEYKLGSVRKIIKITDKTVITNDCNDKGESWYVDSNHWEKIGFILGSLKSETIYLSNEVGRMGEVIKVSE